MQGDLPAAMRWADASGLSLGDEPDFPREAGHLTLACLCIAAGQAEAALPLLNRLLADAETKARMHSALQGLMIHALAYTACTEQGRAVACLERALALAEPEGYVRNFVDEGAPMAELFAQSVARGALNAALGSYAKRLLAAFPG